jgi:hypothetical protein
MSLTVSQLFTAPTAEEIRAAMVADLVSVGIPADKWRSGGVVSTMLTVASMSIALLAALVALIIQGFFLPTSTGNSLKLLAIYMFGVEIPEASFATGNVTLTNTGGASYSLGVGEYTALNPTTKVNYTNSAAFVLGPLGTASVPMVAATIGGAGNAAPGTITTNVTVLLGVTVTNPTALVGVDAPSDEDIRTLCLNSLGARSVRGVRTAYAYAVQTAENSVTNAPVNINRYVVSSASHTGDVTVYVASPAGAPDANDVSGVATNVEAIARPEAVTAVVAGALLAFGLSFDEIVVTNFTAGTVITLPIWIFNHIRLPRAQPVVNVVAMLVILVSIIPVYFAQRLAGGTEGVGATARAGRGGNKDADGAGSAKADEPSLALEAAGPG